MFSTNICKADFWSEPHIPLPNAATRRQVLHKILDTALIAASCVGLVAITLFLTVLSL